MQSSLEKLFFPKTLFFSLGENHNVEYGEYVRFRTKFTYPDGDYIEIFCEKKDKQDYAYVSDLGETLRWLEDNIFFNKLTKEKTEEIEKICDENNVNFHRGIILVKLCCDNNFQYNILNFFKVIMLVTENFIKDM